MAGASSPRSEARADSPEGSQIPGGLGSAGASVAPNESEVSRDCRKPPGTRRLDLSTKQTSPLQWLSLLNLWSAATRDGTRGHPDALEAGVYVYGHHLEPLNGGSEQVRWSRGRGEFGGIPGACMACLRPPRHKGVTRLDGGVVRKWLRVGRLGIIWPLVRRGFESLGAHNPRKRPANAGLTQTKPRRGLGSRSGFIVSVHRADSDRMFGRSGCSDAYATIQRAVALTRSLPVPPWIDVLELCGGPDLRRPSLQDPGQMHRAS